jgi:hypothetical protein
MFAGKFPAWARAFEGEVAQVDLGLVRLAAAPLAFAPECSVIGAFADPFGRIGQVFTGFSGAVVGRQGEYLVFGKVQGW